MLKVYNSPCKNCLLSKDALVSPVRRKDIIESCKKNQRHFICHNSLENNEEDNGQICCKMFFDKLGHHSQNIRIAERLGLVVEVPQPKHEKLMSFKEMTNSKT